MIDEGWTRFEWDEEKNKKNIRKHGVSFEEAQTVFLDDYARIFPDTAHSGDEEKFIIIGMSQRFRILMVCHCLRCGGNVVRIISARKADSMEAKGYDNYRR